MGYMDTIYRAFLGYRKETADDRDCTTQRRAVSKTESDDDCVEVTRVECTIENDWIDTIEAGLVHVEKALGEERQFIRANGEIVPIEKVKRVSRDSVEHLSRHSNLIKKIEDGEDIIPEQLYTVERLNDYAVYENRFLYMLLTYLSEFIGMRYTRILELTNTYRGSVALDKTVSSRQKNISFKLALDETRRDDPIMSELNPNKSVIERIGMLLKTVEHYMHIPLMEVVAKAPKLKPPITKTNVLKMDKNFKGAVALYDYIASYDRDGYTVKTVTKRMMFSEIVADEFAELYALSSFLTYEYGMGIKQLLKENFEEEENRRRAIEEKERLEKLRRLRKRVAESGASPEEYIFELENQLRIYEGIYSKLADARAEIDRLSDENEALSAETKRLNEIVEQLSSEVARLEQKYIDDMAAIKAAHEIEINEINARHSEYIEQLVSEHEQALAEQHDAFTAQIEELHADYKAEIEDLNADYKAQIEYIKEECAAETADIKQSYERKISELTDKHREEVFELEKKRTDAVSEYNAKLDALRSDKEKMEAQYREQESEFKAAILERDKSVAASAEKYKALETLRAFEMGRFNALRHQYGLMTAADDFTSEAAFDEIEKQYDAFRAFFKSEWKKTKKKIRKSMLFGEKSEQTENSDESSVAQIEPDVPVDPTELERAVESEQPGTPEQAEANEKEQVADQTIAIENSDEPPVRKKSKSRKKTATADSDIEKASAAAPEKTDSNDGEGATV